MDYFGPRAGNEMDWFGEMHDETVMAMMMAQLDAQAAQPPGAPAPRQQGSRSPSPTPGAASANKHVNLDQGTLDALAGLIDAADAESEHLEELQCAVCTNPSFKTAVETPCEHMFHRSCIERCVAERGRTCPVCRAGLPAGDAAYREVSRAIRGMLNKTKVQCPQGCGRRVPFEHLETHIYSDDGCPRTPLICSNDPCRAHYLRQDAAAHKAGCSHAIVPCGACGKKLRRGELRRHEERVTCPHCKGHGIPKCGMDAHLHLDCSAAVPMHVVMRMMRELKQEMRRESDKLYNAHVQNHILQHAGVQVRDTVLPKSLGDLLPAEGRRHELRVDGIGCPLVLSRKDDQLFVDCSAYRGPQRLCVSVAGHSTTPPPQGAGAVAGQRWECRHCAHPKEQASGACPECGFEECIPPLVPIQGPPQQGEPPVLIVASQERPQCAGRYTLLPERLNGKGVWGCGNNRIYMHRDRCWRVAINTAQPYETNDSRCLALYQTQQAAESLYPPQHIPLRGYKFRPGVAPRSSITAEFPPQQPADDAGEALCPFAAAAEAAEVRVIILP
eukprot:TRINITY_DN459_c0_g1_i4.p1 TRINITY_DN459_c0_g1~~TRINITY_DN459_c0_g1_i4.p1  ORF type:complete len:583 (+),score=127.67 TRINITY_DN459_c0_g1_i4:79-1749(+)